MFKNVSLAAWDPGKFNESLEQWVTKPDFDLFTNYQKFMETNPSADFHLIDPRSVSNAILMKEVKLQTFKQLQLWGLWKVLQDYTSISIPRNPPSSGFIGIAMLLPICSYLDVVEYIPSTRLNGKCHYYSDEVQSNSI
jgi:beta-galactoside alpha-2,6-sialyltransferase (sialyltransferase 1)